MLKNLKDMQKYEDAYSKLITNSIKDAAFGELGFKFPRASSSICARMDAAVTHKFVLMRLFKFSIKSSC